MTSRDPLADGDDVVRAIVSGVLAVACLGLVFVAGPAWWIWALDAVGFALFCGACVGRLR